jgi:hypothetical protein
MLTLPDVPKLAHDDEDGNELEDEEDRDERRPSEYSLLKHSCAQS